ncbi:MAG: TonB family protein [Acidobacteriota bacterium]|nr:TonB family protein [Acidobacteriota bacterium]
MFDQTFVDTHARTRKPWTFSASIAMQTAIVAVALVVPLMHPEILRPRLDLPLVFTLRHAAPAPPPVTHDAAPHPTAPHGFVAPTGIPKNIAKEVPVIADAPDVMPIAGAIPGAATSGTIPGVNLRPLPEEVPTAKPKPDLVKPGPAKPITVSTGVQAAKLIFGPKPEYPSLAKISRTQGIVRIAAVISADGVIRNLRVIGGPPLLQKAAAAAVSQWRYQPTFLNGAAVEVLTEIDVNFTLQ